MLCVLYTLYNACKHNAKCIEELYIMNNKIVRWSETNIKKFSILWEGGLVLNIKTIPRGHKWTKVNDQRYKLDIINVESKC